MADKEKAGEPVPAPESPDYERGFSAGLASVADRIMEVGEDAMMRVLRAGEARGRAEGLQQGKREGLEEAALQAEAIDGETSGSYMAVLIRSLQSPAAPKEE